MQAETRTTSMKHVGMTRDAMREAVKVRLHIGQQYQIQSGRDNAEDKRKNSITRCKLLYFSKNTAAFEDGDGSMETFTYQELWAMLMKGKIS